MSISASHLISLSLVGILLLSVQLFAMRRLLRYLQFFQQEEYNSRRFLRWLIEKRVYDRRATGALLVLFAVAGYLSAGQPAGLPVWPFLLVLACSMIFCILFTLEEDPRVDGKITLKMTARAKRIYYLACGLFSVTLVLLPIFNLPPFVSYIALAILIQALPLYLTAAKSLLDPDERRRQNTFIAEARAALAAVNPHVIAITGSYGKTTTKAFLGKLLEVTLGPTFWPPKSVNTPMGITRELREKLKSGHKYAVVEMGAYQQGSIRRLCDLVPPKAAIITAVGIMHLERFGSPENVYRAKSELPQAVPDDGILVCNGDNEGSRRMATEFSKRTTLLYGLDREKGPLDAYIDGIATTKDGSTFTLHWKGNAYAGRTKLHGRPALSNILAAFTMAAALGADPAYLVGAIGSLEPFDNRLEVTPVGAGLQINDAYNSNPDGFLAALEVLGELPGDKRILMTPGMVELGEMQAQENTRVARSAAAVCTDVIIVGDTNRDALIGGLRAGGFDETRVKFAANRAEGFDLLNSIRGPKDVVLVENDLPDLFEYNLKF